MYIYIIVYSYIYIHTLTTAGIHGCASLLSDSRCTWSYCCRTSARILLTSWWRSSQQDDDWLLRYNLNCARKCGTCRCPRRLCHLPIGRHPDGEAKFLRTTAALTLSLWSKIAGNEVTSFTCPTLSSLSELSFGANSPWRLHCACPSKSAEATMEETAQKIQRISRKSMVLFWGFRVLP